MTNTEKNDYQADLLANRILKNHRQLKKMMRKNRVSCYRLYDRDIPEIPIAVDLYAFLPENIETKLECAKYYATLQDEISANTQYGKQLAESEKERTYAVLYLYERPYEKDEDEENEWISKMSSSIALSLDIKKENVIAKTRKRQTDGEKRSQYEKSDGSIKIEGNVMEMGQIFKINLSDYIDTGLFFDMRTMRKTIREKSSGKKVLNLFCYTGSFSVYAAEGKANSVTSVDMSRTYLSWARENMELNEFSDSEKYFYENQDVVKFLDEKSKSSEKYDIIILDPPTFSNSKKTDTLLDINRDWPSLVKKCTALLEENGTLYFSTNSRKLSFDETLLEKGFSSKETTAQTIPPDYRNEKIHRIWEIRKSKA